MTTSELPHYHWHIEIIPRLTKVAGFEWGSGFYINPVPPEDAAAFLREVEVGPSHPALSLFERGRSSRLQPRRPTILNLEPERSTSNRLSTRIAMSQFRSIAPPPLSVRESGLGLMPVVGHNRAGLRLPHLRACRRCPCRRGPRLTRGSLMSAVRLILALHNHQPVGNFDGVFEAAYRDSYLPFLEVLEGYPEIPFALHTSGPLLEWLVERQPEYIARVRGLVEAGRVEILGGGFFEPIMTMIPHRDRVGQIRDYSAYLEELFGAPRSAACGSPSGSGSSTWSRPSPRRASSTRSSTTSTSSRGLTGDDLFGYYLTEDEGRLLKIFPGSETPPLHDPVPGAARHLRVPPPAGRAAAGRDRRLRRRRREVRLLARHVRSCLHAWLAPPVLRHDPGQPRLARGDDTGAGGRRDACPWARSTCPTARTAR